MLTGTVPCLHRDAVPDDNTLLIPYENYLPVEGDHTRVAEQITAFNIAYVVDMEHIVNNNYEEIEQFDHTNIAKKILEFADSPSGLHKGEFDLSVQEKCDKKMEHFE